MHISKYCDFALRALMYLGVRPDEIVPANDIARAFGVSTNHLVKSLQGLVREGLVRSVPGRGGGYVLDKSASHTRIGDIVRNLEPNFHIAECFAPNDNTCPLTLACGLHDALYRAKESFLETLNQYTLADLIAPQYQTLLDIGAGS